MIYSDIFAGREHIHSFLDIIAKRKNKELFDNEYLFNELTASIRLDCIGEMAICQLHSNPVCLFNPLIR